ncbi:uncharacterized protein LY89DRAFT_735223 [Mollisia scopiformis]|uniref:Uncharacterized protein n=1 Tax=Mollisia scopiformis TaxID=149040 RepID=A0A194X8G2_MOLSC|nr:uncharacterized protein LY89DRAFT_735223 [Mollisia scopiformis]KUJ16082.1 hypothetical protein LY89DRAFT_735223 [Mollisia scopiformis]
MQFITSFATAMAILSASMVIAAPQPQPDISIKIKLPGYLEQYFYAQGADDVYATCISGGGICSTSKNDCCAGFVCAGIGAGMCV